MLSSHRQERYWIGLHQGIDCHKCQVMLKRLGNHHSVKWVPMNLRETCQMCECGFVYW